MSEPMGPNMRKLLSLYIARIAIPSGGGLDSGLRFFTEPEHMRKVTDEAWSKLQESLSAVRSVPDNPFSNDEEIAGELLRLVDERKAEGAY